MSGVLVGRLRCFGQRGHGKSREQWNTQNVAFRQAGHGKGYSP
jgi:hypothetical protein